VFWFPWAIFYISILVPSAVYNCHMFRRPYSI
jgi:hypothetical protein